MPRKSHKPSPFLGPAIRDLLATSSEPHRIRHRVSSEAFMRTGLSPAEVVEHMNRVKSRHAGSEIVVHEDQDTGFIVFEMRLADSMPYRVADAERDLDETIDRLFANSWAGARGAVATPVLVHRSVVLLDVFCASQGVTPASWVLDFESVVKHLVAGTTVASFVNPSSAHTVVTIEYPDTERNTAIVTELLGIVSVVASTSPLAAPERPNPSGLRPDQLLPLLATGYVGTQIRPGDIIGILGNANRHPWIADLARSPVAGPPVETSEELPPIKVTRRSRPTAAIETLREEREK